MTNDEVKVVGQRLDRFFAGTSKPLRIAFAGLVIGLCGVGFGAALSFTTDPTNPVRYVAGGIVVLGWLVTLAGIVWDWYATFRGAP